MKHKEPNPLWRCHNTPFIWGVNDCALMAADYVLATRGIDFAEEFRGKYISQYQAYRLIHGMGGLRGIIEKKGFVSIPSGFAVVGDVACIKLPKRSEMLGIVTHNHQIVIAGGHLVPIGNNITIYRHNTWLQY